jgi:hypothetical protein
MKCGKGHGDTIIEISDKIDKEKSWQKKLELYMNKKILIPAIIIAIIIIMNSE